MRRFILGLVGFLVIGVLGSVNSVAETLGFSDDFESGPVNTSLWSVGGRPTSWDANDPGSWAWTFSQPVYDAGDTDGYLQARAWGPYTGYSYGAVIWVRSKYNLNDGNTYIENFTWKAHVTESHVNRYFFQITDGDNLPTYQQSNWGDGSPISDPSHSWLESPPVGTVDLLTDFQSGSNLLPGIQYTSDSPKLGWSIEIAPSGVATLYDGLNATGDILGQSQLDPTKAWYTRFMLYDATSAGFGAGDSSLNLYSVSAYAVPEPEPSSFVLLGVGGISLAAYAWRRRRAVQGVALH
ncbi:MAG: PEP-CTERM sorting domain-containing protein [Thermoguttaceae bacterium]|jgi:hypothetical protein